MKKYTAAAHIYVTAQYVSRGAAYLDAGTYVQQCAT